MFVIQSSKKKGGEKYGYNMNNGKEKKHTEIKKIVVLLFKLCNSTILTILIEKMNKMILNDDLCVCIFF